MDTVLYEVFFISDFFELDDIIETTAAHFKKVRWLC